jgi:hypothetical protein
MKRLREYRNIAKKSIGEYIRGVLCVWNYAVIHQLTSSFELCISVVLAKVCSTVIVCGNVRYYFLRFIKFVKV